MSADRLGPRLAGAGLLVLGVIVMTTVPGAVARHGAPLWIVVAAGLPGLIAAILGWILVAPTSPDRRSNR